MNKKAYKDYLNRWKLVAEIEKREIKTTTFELLLRQTISIWDISKSLQFSDKSNSFDSLWVHLQKKWIDRHA
jgi:abortive infection bacteriophage resistance protein